ncbi:hypothetical protein PMAYCL1PPCAC_21482, partial [Pristionchus mayeri]
IYTFPIIPSIIAHVLYYHMAVRRREKRYVKHFLVYQVAVTAILCALFIINTNVSRFVAIPILVHVASCVALCLYSRKIKCGSEDSETGRLPTTIDDSNLNNTKKSMITGIHLFPIV